MIKHIEQDATLEPEAFGTQHVIGKNLRRFMDEEDVSVKMLAEWAGVSEGSLYNIMHGAWNITAYKLYAIAQALQRPMEAFFEEEV